MIKQSFEKKQSQFGDKDFSLAALTNHQFNIKNQNTNHLYQNNTEFEDLSSLQNIMQVEREQVDLKNFIGNGAFGDVYDGLVRYENVIDRVAVKVKI